jgi:hypothetical protein
MVMKFYYVQKMQKDFKKWQCSQALERFRKWDEGRNNLFVILLFLFFTLVDVEVLELEGLLVSSNDTEPVTELVLLQETLGKVLEITLGEGNVGSDGDLGVSATGNLDGITKVVGAVVNLDAVMEVLLESSSIEDLVVSGTRAVNDELLVLLGSSSLSGGHYYRYRGEKRKFHKFSKDSKHKKKIFL